MRFLLDENLPPSLAALLEAEGHKAVHVRDLDMIDAADSAVLQEASSRGAVLLTHDLDFGLLLVVSGDSKPSVIQFRVTSSSPNRLLALLLTSMPGWQEAVAAGALVVIEDEVLRIRPLPIRA